MATAPPAVERCPMCKRESLNKHCTSVTCNWQQCINKTCLAVLYPSRGFGHYLHPKGEVETLGVHKGRVKRLRLVQIAGEWVRRDA